MNTKPLVSGVDDRIKAWVLTNSQNMSLREWAIKADVDPSTLQKYMRAGCKHTISVSVLAKLADVIGDMPALLSSVSTKADRKVPVKKLVNGVLMKNGEVTDVPNGIDVGLKGYALKCEWNSMNLKGIVEGDTLYINPDRKPNLGDIVLVFADKELTLREYQIPYLLPRSSVDHNTIDIAKADIYGVVVASIREHVT